MLKHRKVSPILVHQSDLSALARCAHEYGLRRAGVPTTTNSAAAYGSVMHHAITVFERALATGTSWELARQQARETFVFFWLPANIETICDPVPADGWLPRQSYGELRNRGLEAINRYADLLRFDDHELLATEMSFVVPIHGTWDEEFNEPHYLAGSIDRLSVRHWKRYPFLGIDDFKTGVEQKHLRQNLQGTAYAYATTQPAFWTGFRGEITGHHMADDGFGADRGTELFQRFEDHPRRFTWINLRNAEFKDGGWRGPDDYARFALVVEQFAATVRADVYPLSVSGATCTYCSMRRVCGGTGIPADDHGAPHA